MVKIFIDRKNNSLFFAAVLLVCFLVSVLARYQQFETWEKTPAAYFVGERPMMTTLDAPYWLRMAREYNEGNYEQKDGLRGYPDSTDTFKEMSAKELSLPLKYTDPTPASSSSYLSSSVTPEIRYRDVPLLSYLIAHLSPFFNNNYYLAGTLLIPVLASLFILPLGMYFFRIGVPVSGLLGGLIGTFAGGYYMRSSIGRIDTDMLNLFFPVLASLLILLAGKAKTERNVLLYSVGAGLSLFLFQWWYARAAFTLAYFMVLVFSLFVKKIRFRAILVGAFLFVLCAEPATLISGSGSAEDFLKNYLVFEETASNTVIDNGTTPATFPNVFKTISEADTVHMDEVFRRVLSNTMIGWTGFLAFFALVILRWRVLLPLVPMLALGLLSFQSSNRFIMYLAPFIGIGLGWLLQLVVEGAFYVFTQRRKAAKKTLSAAEKTNHSDAKVVTQKRKKAKEPKTQLPETEFGDTVLTKVDWWNWFRQGVLYLGMAVFFWLISGQTAISFVPGPSIHTGLYATFLEVKKRVPENSALLTWWDYGYAIIDATGLATFHDGSTQFSPKTYFIARGLISANQDELYDITQYLATKGNRGIAENNTSPETLLEAVRNPQHKPWDPIYLFFTADMTGKYGAISKLGSWDIKNGGSKPRGYQNLACNKITNVSMDCRGAKIDLKAGKINNQVPLKRMIFIRDGQVLREQKFGHAQGYSLQILVAGQQIVEVQLIDEEVFRSNYNQMFLLGKYDREIFEETYNAFPFSRLYRFKF
jgi:undecaprenyl-diphosphooligosaccharide--protein glycosyltransferase